MYAIRSYYAIISRDAPLDRYLSGEKNGLSPEALKGYKLFTGKGGCAGCHYGVTLSDGEFHVLQVSENPEHLSDPRIAATRRFVAKVYGFEDFRELVV